MIKAGDKVKIVSLHKDDAYFKNGIAGSIGIVKYIDQTTKKKGIQYYSVSILITELPKTSIPYELESFFFFAYAQLRKVRK